MQSGDSRPPAHLLSASDVAEMASPLSVALCMAQTALCHPILLLTCYTWPCLRLTWTSRDKGPFGLGEGWGEAQMLRLETVGTCRFWKDMVPMGKVHSPGRPDSMP